MSQVRYYAEELRKGAYAIGAPTDHVFEVSGRQPEDFDAIARRYAALPEAKQTTANKLRAVTLMMKTIATRVPDLDQWEKDRDHPLISGGMLAHDSPEWVETAERQLPNLLFQENI